MQKLYCYGDSFTWGCSLNHSPTEFAKLIHPNEYNFTLRYSRKLSHLLNVKEKNRGLNGFAMDDIISMLYNDFILGNIDKNDYIVIQLTSPDRLLFYDKSTNGRYIYRPWFDSNEVTGVPEDRMWLGDYFKLYHDSRYNFYKSLKNLVFLQNILKGYNYLIMDAFAGYFIPLVKDNDYKKSIENNFFVKLRRYMPFGGLATPVGKLSELSGRWFDKKCKFSPTTDKFNKVIIKYLSFLDTKRIVLPRGCATWDEMNNTFDDVGVYWPDDGVNYDGHPNADSHKVMAEILYERFIQ